MRAFLLPILLLTAACRNEGAGDNGGGSVPVAKAEGATTALFAGQGRDRMCLKPDGGAAVITYAASGDASCTLRGDLKGGVLSPVGDAGCRVATVLEGDRIRLGRAGPGCAYYCGPGAVLEGKTFVRMDKPAPVTDIAGDPLC